MMTTYPVAAALVVGCVLQQDRKLPVGLWPVNIRAKSHAVAHGGGHAPFHGYLVGLDAVEQRRGQHQTESGVECDLPAKG